MGDCNIATFHHESKFHKDRYASDFEKVVFSIEKDHFFLTKLKSSAKNIRYDETEAFNIKDPTNKFILLESDSLLYELVKDLRTGALFRLYLKHVISGGGGGLALFLGSLVAGVEQPLGKENSSDNDSPKFEEDDLDGISNEDDNEVNEMIEMF
ncbi:hypothetical protein RND71_042297 [Anisodus tanguticus]|uniref:Uncharacterized protein n=1 Tax=Anisodus tanguticus TaxID=243964 RepID=A0AAE1UUH6_9SOLA|nr:hypothetical protein RND71_042297 [Anisodus tanguticus]